MFLMLCRLGIGGSGSESCHYINNAQYAIIGEVMLWYQIQRDVEIKLIKYYYEVGKWHGLAQLAMTNKRQSKFNHHMKLTI